jgi:predicted PurR-regulated permease PerM
MNHRLALLPVVGALLIIATPAFAGLAQTPEPSTVFLIGGGLGALILFDRYRRAKKK